MWFRIALLLVLSFLSTLYDVPALAGGVENLPGVSSAMLKSEYWLEHTADGKKIIMDDKQISLFNRRIIDKLPNTVYDLKAYPASLDKKTLSMLLGEAKFPEEAYANGSKISKAYQARIMELIDQGKVKEKNPVRYGFTVRRTNLRTLPMKDGVFGSSSDREFDKFQETAADPVEPVVILHQSADAAYYYIQMKNYRGWVDAKDIAIAVDRNSWLSYMQSAGFLVVTASTLKVEGEQLGNGSEFLFQMGAKIPLAEGQKSGENGFYTAKLPIRDKAGRLGFQFIKIPDSPAVHAGYLAYTRENILKQAFRMLGDRYGWGGLWNSVDCSSFIANIYRTIGIDLPRNADEQESSVGQTTSFTNITSEERLRRLREMPPGSAVYMNGHVMLYLGQNNGKPYIIHSLGSYGKRDVSTGAVQWKPVMKVVVSDLSLTRVSGTTFLDSLTSGKKFQ
jgi:hypothetical protein